MVRQGHRDIDLPDGNDVAVIVGNSRVHAADMAGMRHCQQGINTRQMQPPGSVAAEIRRRPAAAEKGSRTRSGQTAAAPGKTGIATTAGKGHSDSAKRPGSSSRPSDHAKAAKCPKNRDRTRRIPQVLGSGRAMRAVG